jgi:hypothetical protein
MRVSSSHRITTLLISLFWHTCGAAEISLQLRVLGLGFLQDGDVGVGVFPERKEDLAASLRLLESILVLDLVSHPRDGVALPIHKRHSVKVSAHAAISSFAESSQIGV